MSGGGVGVQGLKTWIGVSPEIKYKRSKNIIAITCIALTLAHQSITASAQVSNRVSRVAPVPVLYPRIAPVPVPVLYSQTQKSQQDKKSGGRLWQQILCQQSNPARYRYIEIWQVSRHLGSLTAVNWVSFDFNVSYSSCWGYYLIIFCLI